MTGSSHATTSRSSPTATKPHTTARSASPIIQRSSIATDRPGTAGARSRSTGASRLGYALRVRRANRRAMAISPSRRPNGLPSGIASLGWFATLLVQQPGLKAHAASAAPVPVCRAPGGSLLLRASPGALLRPIYAYRSPACAGCRRRALAFSPVLCGCRDESAAPRDLSGEPATPARARTVACSLRVLTVQAASFSGCSWASSQVWRACLGVR